jgi:selenocysteine-specific elongation factor
VVVVATAGHVDHGKSTLVRWLSGTDPDRLPEEQRRGLTVDLGFARAVLPSGRSVSLVDVPGHERYVTNALAGLAPVRAVLLAVAADGGWSRQTDEHVQALRAMGIRHVLAVVTRTDAAGARADAVAADVAARLSGTHHVEVVRSPGVEDARAALDRLLDVLPPADRRGRARLWVDRAFTVRGRGPVVTGTLGAGGVRVGDVLEAGGRGVRVRGLQVHGTEVGEVVAEERVAVALSAPVQRGTPLVVPGAWHLTEVVDVELATPLVAGTVAWVLHVGTADVAVSVRPLGRGHARLRLPSPLPLAVGDRAVLRAPGARGTDGRVPLLGVEVVDVAPPALARRGAAAARAAQLATSSPLGTALSAGPVRRDDLTRRGLRPAPAPGVVQVGEWLALSADLDARAEGLRTHVEALPVTSTGLPLSRAADLLGLPGDPSGDLLAEVAARAGLAVARGEVRNPRHGLGAAAPAVARVEGRLRDRAFDSPDRGELRELGLDARALATAAATGRLLRLAPDVVVLPDAPARALEALAALDQPFAVGDATRALGASRRVVVPLLEHLDATGATERDGAVRRVRPPAAGR